MTPESRDLARARLRRLTARIGVGAIGATGLLAAVAALTIPGQQAAAAGGSALGGAAPASGTVATTGQNDQNEGGAAQPPTQSQLQPAMPMPQPAAGGRPRAVTGGSR